MDKRQLPWRAESGEIPDPYRVWLSEIMLQQTNVVAAAPYFERFVAAWPDLAALASAEDEEVMRAWAGLGYYARARNLLACARKLVADHDGRFPEDEAALRGLPGIGRYTAGAIAAIAFGRRAAAVDGNVERVVARLFAIQAPLSAARRQIQALAQDLVPEQGAGDFAQAMMDLGAAICTPRNPDCGRCPLKQWCAAYGEGAPEAYPVKAPRAERPHRNGRAYWLEHDGAVLLVRRPPRGLLGGMAALPTDDPPADADWQEAGAVEHVFTHFALTMTLLCARSPTKAEGLWWPIHRLDEAGLPTLFTKLAARGAAWREKETAAGGVREPEKT